ncbi:receptor homology region, transmembrane domain- and RING domain-containing protein 2 isoform X1 [Selaginella moellendorffii]|uniref:receptor homology region, transmembrane domain- and RING domain-containing protein 2 isoform X1 n=1 Tax=Selaginella moellendorffii TaxID=88036 RepID=UPI000D1CB9EB|nr:receptor homology region, transmembrane domain- and RING domain-containing protein 2 isoform X1 [Selaginella moellendorffii]|eukprot:XP_024533107.1 receptor homology region, transmembrane domain- and RING domain-containing protein 2 isoform X1 [Selaginella moellendorffii]
MFLSLFFLAIVLLRANATVVITTPTNQSMPFSDMEAGFAPRVPQAGILGLLYRGNPLDACDPLKTGPALDQSPFSSFVLVKRGACRFETKVRNAQDAGFSAVIVYNDEDGRDLVINVILSYFFFAVSGDSYGIKIPAVFVSHAAGKVLWRYAGNPQTRCFIFPTLDYPAWSVMAVAFISLLAVTAVLATFFFVRRHRLRRLGSRLLLPREPPGLTSSEVRSLPTFVYRRAGDGDDQADTCVICMEEYEDGQKLRVLPCRHAFHAACVDQWLVTRKPFCPVCKRDAHAKSEAPTASESTPLLTARAPAAVAVPAQTSASPLLHHSGSPIPVPAPAPPSDTLLFRSASLTNTAPSSRTVPAKIMASSWPRGLQA